MTTATKNKTFTVRHTVRILTDVTIEAPEGTDAEDLDMVAFLKLPSAIRKDAVVDAVQIYDEDGLVFETEG